MKLTFLLMLVACLQVSADVKAQSITYSKKDITLEKVFMEIRNQTGYEFLYNTDMIEKANKINLQLEDAPLKMALNDIFKDQPLAYTIIGKTIVVKGKTDTLNIFPKSVLSLITIHGNVTDATTGKVLIGVTIQVKGSTMGTTTDSKGNFTLEAPDNAVLIVSYLGYNTKGIPVKGKNIINITLSAATTGLNQLVVVGYGTEKKVDLTGAVAQVSGKRLQNRPITNVSEGLQGLIANLNVTTTTSGGTPGASKALNIRGYTGLGVSDAPLILVDGVATDNIDEINPNDIATITVLKDAASSAIYGSRAPYGVILITTKQGKEGQPLQLTYTDNFSWSQTINRPHETNSLDFAILYNEAAENAGRPDFYSAANIAKIKAVIANPKLPGTMQDPGAGRELLWLGYYSSWANTDWYTAFMRNWSPSEQHNIGLSGGGKSVSYYFGLGYNNKGAMDRWFNDGYHRYNLRSNITSHVNKWITLTFRGSFDEYGSNYPSDFTGQWQDLYQKMPTSPLFVPGGGMWRDALAMTDSGGVQKNTEDNSSLTEEIQLNPLPGWEIHGNYTYNYSSAFGSTSHYYPQFMTPLGTRYPYYPNDASISENTTLTHYHTFNIYTSYEKHLSGHYFKLMVGYQQEYDHYSYLSASNGYLYSADIPPTLGVTYGTNLSAGDDFYTWATEGTFVRFNYNFKDKYLLEFNGRYDGASPFPAANRYHFFPSISAGYNIAKEKYWQSIGASRWVDNLKLRVSYGELGDVTSLLDEGDYYLYQTTLNARSPQSNPYLFGDGQESSISPGGLKTPNVTWAKPSMLDFGIDVTALNDRLDFTYDWYRRRTTDLYGPPQQFPAVLGASPAQQNNASIQTVGFDLTTSWKDHIGQLYYSAHFILSNYKGTVLSYPNPTGSISTWYDKEKMGAIWGFQTVGLFQSQDAVSKAPSQAAIGTGWSPGDVQYKDLNGDGKITYGQSTLSDPGDRKVIGNSTPEFNYGLTVDLQYKGFDFQGFLQGVAKREFFPQSAFFFGITGSEWGSNVLTTVYNNRWTPTTPNGYFPKFYMSGEVNKNELTQTRYLLNGAYLRLKNIQLGYTLPLELTKKIHVTKLRIYFSAENMLTTAPGLGNKYQVDPELLISSGNIYPLQRTFSFGVNLTVQ